MRTEPNSEWEGITQKAAELLNLKNSLLLSSHGLWKISASGEFDLET